MSNDLISQISGRISGIRPDTEYKKNQTLVQRELYYLEFLFYS